MSCVDNFIHAVTTYKKNNGNDDFIKGIENQLCDHLNVATQILNDTNKKNNSCRDRYNLAKNNYIKYLQLIGELYNESDHSTSIYNNIMRQVNDNSTCEQLNNFSKILEDVYKKNYPTDLNNCIKLLNKNVEKFREFLKSEGVLGDKKNNLNNYLDNQIESINVNTSTCEELNEVSTNLMRYIY